MKYYQFWDNRNEKKAISLRTISMQEKMLLVYVVKNHLLLFRAKEKILFELK
jgi:hypothetical protein